MKRNASLRVSPAFTARTVNAPVPFSSCSALITGISDRQLPHQVAQKLISTGRPRSSLSRTRDPSGWDSSKSGASLPSLRPVSAGAPWAGGVSSSLGGETNGSPADDKTKTNSGTRTAASTAPPMSALRQLIYSKRE